MIASARAAALLGKPLYLAALWAIRDLEMSAECNEHFCQMIAANRCRLPNADMT